MYESIKQHLCNFTVETSYDKLTLLLFINVAFMLVATLRNALQGLVYADSRHNTASLIAIYVEGKSCSIETLERRRVHDSQGICS